MTAKERVLWCAVKYAHAIDDNESTEAVIEELRARLPYLGNTALWEIFKAVRGYEENLERYGAKHFQEWEAVYGEVKDELSLRDKMRRANP